MSVPVQRWLFGRDSYRPSGECINPREYEVAELAGDSIAKGFVLTHHYAGTYPAARFRFGLFRGERLVGVAVYSVPCNDRVLACLPGSPRESVELGRFVLEDSVPGNGESWFLARTFALLRAKGLVGVVSFSDPVRRRSHAGALVFPGHVGIIYQASIRTGPQLGRGRASLRCGSWVPRAPNVLDASRSLAPGGLEAGAVRHAPASTARWGGTRALPPHAARSGAGRLRGLPRGTRASAEGRCGVPAPRAALCPLGAASEPAPNWWTPTMC